MRTTALSSIVLVFLLLQLSNARADDSNQGTPWMGVVVKDRVSNAIPRSGAVVESVAPDSPASKIGVVEGDIITAWAGRKIGSKSDFDKAVAGSVVGKRYSLGVMRKFEEQYKFGEWPITIETAPASGAPSQAFADALTLEQRIREAFPTTKPPSVEAYRAATTRAYKAQESLELSGSSAVSRVHNSREYRVAETDATAKEKALESAREGGTPQDKLDASAAYGRARKVLRDIEANGLNNDSVGNAAREEIAAARLAEQNARAALEADLRAREQEEARRKALSEAERMKHRFDPSNDLPADQAYETVTAKQLELFGERYKDKKIKLLNCSFGEASNTWVTNLPSVFIDTDGLTVTYNKKEMEKWIGFGFRDSDDHYFSYAFASKELMGEYLAAMKHGTKVNVSGVVLPLKHMSEYGLICDKVERIP